MGSSAKFLIFCIKTYLHKNPLHRRSSVEPNMNSMTMVLHEFNFKESFLEVIIKQNLTQSLETLPHIKPCIF